MAHETLWIKSGKRELALPRPGAHVMTPEGKKIAQSGDLLERDEHGDVHVILAIDADEDRKKYEAGVKKLAKAG